MDLGTQVSDHDPPPGDDQSMHTRLAAIEKHMHHIETVLTETSQFNSRLDQIHATLELAIGLLTPDRHAVDSTHTPSPTPAHHDEDHGRFHIVAHIRRGEHGARLVSDVSWPDTWSVRLYVTALLRNLPRSRLASSSDCRCWCEVWTPDETGTLIDSAFLDPETGAIEWESDLLDRDDVDT